METQSLLEKAQKWLNEWEQDLTFINTNMLLMAFMEGYKAKEDVQKEKAPKAYEMGIAWVVEYNKGYSGAFFTRGCVIRAYIKGLTLNI